MTLDSRLVPAYWALRIGLGGAALLAGLDKFFGILTDWTAYLNPLVAQIVPLTPQQFMGAVGVIEMIVGLAVLTRFTRLGALVASVWLVAIAVNLAAMGSYFDVAVRDVGMAIAAFTLARLSLIREESVATERVPSIAPARVVA